MTHTEKIGMIRGEMRECGAHATVISMLDEVAWLYNIRGGDVPCNPVSICYAVVTAEKAHLFIDERKLVRSADPKSNIFSHLAAADISVHPYEEIDAFLLQLYEFCALHNHVVFCDHNQLNYRLYSVLTGQATSTKPAASTTVLENRPSLISLPKAVKNEVEVEGTRQAHIRDGVALSAFLYWLEARYADPTAPRLTECEADGVLEGFRKRVALFRHPSFETIAGYGANGKGKLLPELRAHIFAYIPLST